MDYLWQSHKWWILKIDALMFEDDSLPAKVNKSRRWVDRDATLMTGEVCSDASLPPSFRCSFRIDRLLVSAAFVDWIVERCRNMPIYASMVQMDIGLDLSACFTLLSEHIRMLMYLIR